jgi:hypothetical protein
MREQPNKAKANRVPSSGKKVYRAPRLAVYGDLRTITKAKGGTADDGGGKPATKK